MIHNDFIGHDTRRSGVRWRKGSMVVELERAVGHILKSQCTARLLSTLIPGVF